MEAGDAQQEGEAVKPIGAADLQYLESQGWLLYENAMLVRNQKEHVTPAMLETFEVAFDRAIKRDGLTERSPLSVAYESDARSGELYAVATAWMR